MEKYITVKEASGLLCITPQTLRKWEKKGYLVPCRNPVNNYRMYEIRQIEKFIEDMRNERLRRGRFRLRVKIVEEN